MNNILSNFSFKKSLYVFAFIIIAFLLFLSPFAYAKQKQLNLSPSSKNAINSLAKDMLLNGPSSRITSLKPQLDPQDYKTVKNIGILPDSPWYIFKNIGRSTKLFFIFDQVGKTYQLLKDGNEKTLESLLVVEKAANEKDAIKQDQLVNIAANTLDGVGSDFDSVTKTLDSVKKTDSIQAYLLQEEAFQFAGYYLKHQILLQKQQDRLNEKDFLLLESARVKHLSSIAHIVVGENRDPVIFGQQLSQLLSSEVGSNNTQLATIAVLRDLENSANTNEIPQLQNAQTLLQKELEVKLRKLSKTERLKQIERYIAFVHGNPIREFQAYNFVSKSFTSSEMNILTQALKDKTAQDFKKHLAVLDTKDIQEKFVETLFSTYPIDMRLLIYTEIQLNNDKNAKDKQKSEQARVELTRLEQIKSILAVQVCQTYGKDTGTLTSTRFYKEATTAPSLLDVRIGEFLNQSLQNCSGRGAQALATISDLRIKINSSFATIATGKVFKSLPSKTKAQELLKEENITVSPQDEQKVAEKIEEETKQIEEEISENPTILEEKVQQIVETGTTPIRETVTSDSETIIEEIVKEAEPTSEEITQKEEQIIEEIVDAAEIGETSPLVEELPEKTQQEINQETGITPTPTPTSSPTSTPTSTPTTILEPVVTTVQEQTESNASTPTPTPTPTVTVPSL